MAGNKEWQRFTLSDLTENYDAQRIPVKEGDRKPGPYPYYGASGVVDSVDNYLFDGEYLLVAEDGENLRTRKTPVAFMATGKFWVNNHAHILRVNANADTRFLMYALAQSDIGGYLTGSTMPKLTQANLNRIPIYTPALSEQRAIAHILGTLDDKIELNRRMNVTLESIARALFKSWFVDFDPVRAKAEGRQSAGMDAETAALFPDGFEESALGEIPRGWSVSKIGDLIEFAYGKALKEEMRHLGSVPVYGSNGQVGWHDEALANGPGIVVGRKGNPGTVTWVHNDFFPIDTTFYVVPTGPIQSMYYLFHTLSLQNLASLAADSAVPGLNRNMAYMTKLLVPPPEVLEAFDKCIGVCPERVSANVEESRTMAAIRDALLPKLLSGEIRVKEAEKLVEAKI